MREEDEPTQAKAKAPSVEVDIHNTSEGYYPFHTENWSRVVQSNNKKAVKVIKVIGKGASQIIHLLIFTTNSKSTCKHLEAVN